MKYIADLHVHSSHSIATSRFSNLEGFYQWGKIKGINLIGTGDFTHPAYFSEIKEKLVQSEEGFYKLKEPPSMAADRMPVMGIKCEDIPVRFCLSGEISSIYKKNDKTRKVHSVVFAPSIEVAEKIRTRLGAIGNIKSDGRPILGLDPKDLLDLLLEISEEAYLVPAHIWTPWFSLFGSKSGFDAIEECFEELTPHIFALETGLSSDPEMNWRWSALDRYTLISNSDAHSPGKLGREANLFDAEYSYSGMFGALKSKDGFLGTLEFFPEEGKYHMDGHRKCNICLEPEETRELKGICPECGKKLTVGVLHRVLELADREKGAKPEGAPDFNYIIPLPEIISEIFGKGPATKGVLAAYSQVVSSFGSEFNLLFDVPLEDIEKKAGTVYREAVLRMRSGLIHPNPGYDGEFGVINVFRKGEVEKYFGQDELFDLGVKKKTVRSKNRASIDKQPVKRKKELRSFKLNEQQAAVLKAAEGALLITAGPGTGKTRTLTSWIENLLKSGKALPGEVLAITFTNKAALEMRERLGGAPAMHITTFHSFCYDLLQEHYPGLNIICDDPKRLSILKMLLGKDAQKQAGSIALRLRDWFENTETGLDEKLSAVKESYLALLERTGAVDLAFLINRVLQLFACKPEFLATIRDRFKYIAVDELQDINPAQFRLISALAGESPGEGCLLAIGDPDQAIYGFRGSDVKLFFTFGEKFNATPFELVKNYRSSGHIVQGASTLIASNQVKSGLDLLPGKGSGEKIRLLSSPDTAGEGKALAFEIAKLVGGMSMNTADSSLDRHGYYSFSDIAVLFRTKAVGEALVPFFRKAGIPVGVRDSKPLLEREPFTLVNSLLCVILNSADLPALRSSIEAVDPRAGGVFDDLLRDDRFRDMSPMDYLTWLRQEGRIDAESYGSACSLFTFIEELGVTLPEEGIAGVLDRIFVKFFADSIEEGSVESFEWEVLREMAKPFGPHLGRFYKRIILSPNESEYPYKTDKVNFLTFHAAKGLEFPVVFIAGADDSITPMKGKKSDIEEERRLFYVAMTRACDLLYISSAGKREIFHRTLRLEPSPFIAEIPGENKAPYAVKKSKPEDPYKQQTLFE